MKLFLFDLETTGLDVENCRVLEHGFIVYDWLYQKPILQHSSLWYANNYPEEWPDAEKINGLTPAFVKQNGKNPKETLYLMESALRDCDYLVAQNGKAFDQPFLKNEVKRWGMESECGRILNMPLLDTKLDLPWDNAPRSRHLGHIAYDLGVIHDPREKHSALFDCQLMLGILKKFDLEKVIFNSTSPEITLRAWCSFETKELAKQGGFGWNKEKSLWLKTIRLHELENETKKAEVIGFKVTVV